MSGSLNTVVADRLREAAQLLEQQDANRFRVAAYRRAAETVDGLDDGVDEILANGGVSGLTELPNVGDGIAGAIREMVREGRWGLLERLRGSVEPEDVFETVPGIGPVLASRIADELEVETLEELETAAHDGRLESLEGVGESRGAAIRASLQAMLGRTGGGRSDGDEGPAPSVETLLDVDREYRQKADAGKLSKIAPRRFNPDGERWLPILHTDRGEWSFTVLFSNTARAHELERTDDWVVIYHYDGGQQEGRHTVVTERRSGPLEGRRVVRGREKECRELYAD